LVKKELNNKVPLIGFAGAPWTIFSYMVEGQGSKTFSKARKMLYTNSVIPELYKVRDELNRWLAPNFGDKLFIDFDISVIPELQEETEKVVSQMTQAWWLTPNEKRMAMSYGKDEENPAMDDYYVPANTIVTFVVDPAYPYIRVIENSGTPDVYVTELY